MDTDTAWKSRAGAVCRLLLIAMAGLAVAGSWAWAQPDDAGEKAEDLDLRPVTRTFAIRNARIVQAPGKVIERGTVVVRDGLIVAVGEGIAIPFDARVIEGDSMVVYAGFIDGLSYAGVPKPKAPENQPPIERAGDPPNDRAGIRPERDVRDLIVPGDPSVDSLRMTGFTVAHVVPQGEMLPGSGAIVSLSGEKPGEMVLRGDASLYARFAPADDMYPATTMGIMAKWRQLYREAERRRGHRSSYSENPGGIERPKYDPVLDAFFPVIEGRKPVVFAADGPLEVHRVLALQKDLKFPLVIAGLKNAADITSVLKSANVPIFLSLDLPREKKDDSASKKGGDSLAALDTARAVTPAPPADFFVNDRRIFSYKDVVDEHKWLDSRQRSIRRLYYGTPAALVRDGLRFGFSTAGARLGDLRENLRLVVKNGLAEDAALAALTTDAARLLGLDKSLGTVEKGKIGNLVVTKGSYFDEKSLVRYVFVDGRMYEYNADAKIADAKKDSTATTGDSLASKSVPDDTLRENPVLARRRDAEARGNLLIKNGTVLTVTNGTLEKTDVLVRNGKIAQIGEGIGAPSGFDTIDATGMYVMPGVIDAHSHIAISDVNEWTNPITAEVWVGDVLDPYDISIYRALGGGVTTSHVMHGSANVIGGQCETIKHRYGSIDPEGLVMEGAPRTIKFALGENPTRVHGRGYKVHPSTRMGVEDVMRQGFTEAKRYMEAKERYESDRKNDSRAVGPAYNLRLETLAAILRGEIIVHCHSYRADEILMVMRVFRDFGIKRVIFQHVNEGFKVAPELAQFGAMASVFSDWWAYKFEVYYSTAYNAAILTRNGVTTSINSDSPELNRHLYHEASKTMKYGGLEGDEALKLITINPARQLGIDDRVGSLEVGKEADIAIFSAHPLSVYAVCQKTIVDGVIRFDRAHDPDDMRLYIDPRQSIETATIWKEHEDRCMQGTEKHLHEVFLGH